MPLDPLFTMPTPETKKEYELIPDDIYPATVKDVENIISKFKDQETGEDKPVIKFTFEISEGEHKGRYQWVEAHPAAYIGKAGPTKLLQIINAVRGVDLTQEEARNVNAETINDLVGRPLRLTITHKTSQAGNTYNRIGAFMASKEEYTGDQTPPVASIEF